MKYGYRTPDLGKSIAAKLSISRMLKQQLGFGKGLIPDRKKSKYNKRYSKRVKKFETSEALTIQSDRVKAIQQKLKKLGFLSGDITGKMDNKTVQAIKKFQKEASISVTGLLDLKTMSELDKRNKKGK